VGEIRLETPRLALRRFRDISLTRHANARSIRVAESPGENSPRASPVSRVCASARSE